MSSGIVNSVAFAGLGLLVALAGCTRTSDLNQGSLTPTRSAAPLQPAPLQPAPLQPVSGGALQPVTPTAPPATTTAPQPEKYVPPTEAAAKPEEKPVVVASASSKPVTRQALVGAWTVSTGGKHCQIFLALTKWSGGYRAATRGCNAAAISDVQAWDVKGKEIVLVNSTGGTAAKLYRSAEERYDGSATSGGSISFTR